MPDVVSEARKLLEPSPFSFAVCFHHNPMRGNCAECGRVASVYAPASLIERLCREIERLRTAATSADDFYNDVFEPPATHKGEA